MKAILETLAIFRYAQARIALQWCHWRYERDRTALADAHVAVTRAWANLRATELPPCNTEPHVPEYLARVGDAPAEGVWPAVRGFDCRDDSTARAA